MLIKITYPTNKRNYINEVMYQNVVKKEELAPVRIRRTPCGSGVAANRYYYHGYFPAPTDAAFIDRGGTITANVDRKTNPQFNPKKLEWVDDVWTA